MVNLERTQFLSDLKKTRSKIREFVIHSSPMATPLLGGLLSWSNAVDVEFCCKLLICTL